MTATEISIEEVRVFSKLSERYHILSDNGRRYVCFSGIVLPIDVAQTAFLWVLVGAKYYARLIEGRMEEIKRLNTENPEITAIQESGPMAAHLKIKLEGLMKTWGPEQFEDVIPT